MGNLDFQISAPAAANKEYAETDELADNSGPGCACDSQLEYKNQEGIQSDIQNCTTGDPDLL